MNDVQFSEIAVLILAAGSSTRMGKPKQLLPWRHKTLIEHAVDTARSLTKHFEVVLGAHAAKIKPLIPGERTTVNEKWAEGMGSSIVRGVTEIAAKYAPEAILIMVVDQPLLELEHYKNLIRTYRNHSNKICSSSYQRGPGVPALFPKVFFKELKKLGADFGARKLMEAHTSSVVMIETKGELIDLDTPDDYRLICSRFEE
ncbi:MAG: nucleotidyltransferase family protein [Bacteroidota bacterium]